MLAAARLLAASVEGRRVRPESRGSHIAEMATVIWLTTCDTEHRAARAARGHREPDPRDPTDLARVAANLLRTTRRRMVRQARALRLVYCGAGGTGSGPAPAVADDWGWYARRAARHCPIERVALGGGRP
ncbi:hypothetical protein B1806_11260 [Metallibacterium scheffleri]|uniref:Uncharacterized protein n=2 Tax=Metallibacterium scheffleri TaxID=993689 RepID=A0A4S3KKF0_9GAMM|nr:hypothetical protein B1806_11260 [Metallibacterium scheffleri]